MLIDRGEPEAALELLETVEGSLRADGLAARLRLQGEGLFEDAFAALDRGELEQGLELLLEALPSAQPQRDEIRRLILGELDALDPQDPLASATRRRLAAALY